MNKIYRVMMVAVAIHIVTTAVIKINWQAIKGSRPLLQYQHMGVERSIEFGLIVAAIKVSLMTGLIGVVLVTLSTTK